LATRTGVVLGLDDVCRTLDAMLLQANLLLRARRPDEALELTRAARQLLERAAEDHPDNPFLAVWEIRVHCLRARASKDNDAFEREADAAVAAAEALAARKDTAGRRGLVTKTRDEIERARREGGRKREVPPLNETKD
jgi:hypothetical protein